LNDVGDIGDDVEASMNWPNRFSIRYEGWKFNIRYKWKTRLPWTGKG